MSAHHPASALGTAAHFKTGNDAPIITDDEFIFLFRVGAIRAGPCVHIVRLERESASQGSYRVVHDGLPRGSRRERNVLIWKIVGIDSQDLLPCLN